MYVCVRTPQHVGVCALPSRVDVIRVMIRVHRVEGRWMLLCPQAHSLQQVLGLCIPLHVGNAYLQAYRCSRAAQSMWCHHLRSGYACKAPELVYCRDCSADISYSCLPWLFIAAMTAVMRLVPCGGLGVLLDETRPWFLQKRFGVFCMCNTYISQQFSVPTVTDR